MNTQLFKPEDIKIENDVPLFSPSYKVFQFGKMKIGDSFCMDSNTFHYKTHGSASCSLRQFVKQYKKYSKKKFEFKISVLQNGKKDGVWKIRLWRTG